MRATDVSKIDTTLGRSPTLMILAFVGLLETTANDFVADCSKSVQIA